MGSSNGTLSNNAQDVSQPTYIGYKISPVHKNCSNSKYDHQLTYIYCTRSEKTLLYTATPIVIGGHLFNAMLFCSKIGLGDQDFQDNLNLQF